MDATYNNYSYLESGSFFIISNGFHGMGQIVVVSTFQDLAYHNAVVRPQIHSKCFAPAMSGKGVYCMVEKRMRDKKPNQKIFRRIQLNPGVRYHNF